MRNFIILTLIFVFAIGIIDAEAKGWKIHSPKDEANKTEITVSGKKKTYYPISKAQSITVDVKGPRRLRVLSRLAANDLSGKNSEYKLWAKDENGKMIEKTLKTHLSKESHLANNKKSKVGVGRNWYINVPAGTHTYTISTNQDIMVYVRFFTKPQAKKKKVSRVAITPKSYDAVVSLVYKEKELEYYRATPKKSIEIEIYGPTKLKFISRLEFDPTMKGDKTYRVQVLEKGNVVKTLQIDATKSEVTTYRKKTTNVPAKGESYYLKVPDGKHRYEFRVLNGNSSVLFRFFIPQEDVRNGD